jgi:hypothetical protein
MALSLFPLPFARHPVFQRSPVPFPGWGRVSMNRNMIRIGGTFSSPSGIPDSSNSRIEIPVSYYTNFVRYLPVAPMNYLLNNIRHPAYDPYSSTIV